MNCNACRSIKLKRSFADLVPTQTPQYVNFCSRCSSVTKICPSCEMATRISELTILCSLFLSFPCLRLCDTMGISLSYYYLTFGNYYTSWFIEVWYCAHCHLRRRYDMKKNWIISDIHVSLYYCLMFSCLTGCH